ncbi:MAG: prolipoprotein diacylglyceryl transferase [Candidatus Levybacteria bacterium]|nr:prolipoprotein diacylglyceryl transferase [Candidatus Levybacteria bacterium]
MYLFLLFLIFCLLVFLFTLYRLTHDDYIFLRKDISLHQIFNAAFLDIFAGLIFSRFFYVVFNPDVKFLNPLVFILFPYFPGLSITGGIIGGAGFLFVYFRNKKIPAFRLFDFFSLSFLSSVTFGLLTLKVIDITTRRFNNPFNFATSFLYLLSFIFLIKIILPVQRRGGFKDGSLGLSTLIAFSLTSFIIDIFSNTQKIYFFLGKEDFVLLGMILVSLYFLNKQEKLIQRIKGIKK